MAVTGRPADGLRVAHGGSSTDVAAGLVLAIHGVPVQEVDLARACLHGGEVVRGALLGGDANGMTVTVLSPVLGSVVVPVDRLVAFLAPGNAALHPEQLPLPAGVDEALVTRARIGFDLLAGTLGRFTDEGVRFVAADADAPRLFRTRDFVALRFAAPLPRAVPAPALLLTRTGDRIGVQVRELTAAAAVCELEQERLVEVRWADLACLCFLDAATWLSDLAPTAVDEAGCDGPVLYPWRRDRDALGGPLAAGERPHAKGLGVHSRSRLGFTVPAGAAVFWSRVALDDSAAGLPIAADVDVRVLRGGEVVFERRGLGAGATADTGLVPVTPGERLWLEVDFGKGRDLGDRVDWLSPVFLPPPR
jgi:hypothetical protein